MRFQVLMLTALMFVACDDAPAPATLGAIPPKYVGVWDVSLADCAAGGGPQAVTIGANEVVFPDSRLAVTGAAPDGELAVRADGHFSGPGAEWDGSVRLELDGETLSVVNGNNIVPRVKCP